MPQMDMRGFQRRMEAGAREVPAHRANAIIEKLVQMNPNRQRAAGELRAFVDDQGPLGDENRREVKKLLPLIIQKLRPNATDEYEFWILSALASCAKHPDLRVFQAQRFWQDWSGTGAARVQQTFAAQAENKYLYDDAYKVAAFSVKPPDGIR